MIDENNQTTTDEVAGDDIGADLLTDPTRVGELLAWAEAQGVDPADALLASELARAPLFGPQVDITAQNEFVDDVLPLLRQGQHGLARRWLIWLAYDSDHAIVTRLTDAQDRAAADALFDKHRAAAAGKVITPAQWRMERRNLRKALSPEVPDCISAALEDSMWDLASVPGAIADVASSWLAGAGLFDAVVESGWSWNGYTAFQREWEAFSARTPPLIRGDDETDEEFEARRIDHGQKYQPDISEADFERSSEMFTLFQKIATERLAEMRAAFVALMRSA